MPVYWEKQGQPEANDGEAGADAGNKDQPKSTIPKRTTSKQFFLNTDLLTDKMKEQLEKKFVSLRKDRMPEVQ